MRGGGALKGIHKRGALQGARDDQFARCEMRDFGVAATALGGEFLRLTKSAAVFRDAFLVACAIRQQIFT